MPPGIDQGGVSGMGHLALGTGHLASGMGHLALRMGHLAFQRSQNALQQHYAAVGLPPPSCPFEFEIGPESFKGR